MKRVCLVVLSLLLLACEEEIGRLDLRSHNTEEIVFDLEKDREVKFWTEIDIEYREKPLFVYDFEFFKGEEFMLKGGTDPLVTMNNKNETLTTKDGVTHWKFYGRLDGNFVPKSDGIYTFKTTFVKNNKPDLKINKAEIVFVK